mmetsp:Transcript_123422/g.356812  ORF Transcript_123422/g.356812 Transcript_123422/m.356812 type:complete len:206 (-) Transcript_123422:120-737(-)
MEHGRLLPLTGATSPGGSHLMSPITCITSFAASFKTSVGVRRLLNSRRCASSREPSAALRLPSQPLVSTFSLRAESCSSGWCARTQRAKACRRTLKRKKGTSFGPRREVRPGAGIHGPFDCCAGSQISDASSSSVPFTTIAFALAHSSLRTTMDFPTLGLGARACGVPVLPITETAGFDFEKATLGERALRSRWVGTNAPRRWVS